MLSFDDFLLTRISMKKNNIFLSIVTCTYNSEKHLQECIDSVISQNLDPKEFEHIFVDGYSTDNTIKIIKEYIKKFPNHTIKVIQRQKNGVYNAMNQWIKAAKWKYLNMLNSDDYWESDAIKGYIDFIKKTWEKEIYCGYNYIVSQTWNKQERIPKCRWKKITIETLLDGNPINPQAVFYQKQLHNSFWFYDEKLIIYSAYLFWLLIINQNIQIHRFKKCVVNFRNWWISDNNQRKWWIEKIKCQKRFLKKNIYIIKIIKIIFYVLIIHTIIKSTQKIWIYSYISPLWRKYILKT